MSNPTVRRTCDVGNVVDRDRQVAGLEVLLEFGLRILAKAVADEAVQGPRKPGEHLGATRVDPSVEVNGADDSLEGICEVGVPLRSAAPFFAFTENELRSQHEASGQPRQGFTHRVAKVALKRSGGDEGVAIWMMPQLGHGV